GAGGRGGGKEGWRKGERTAAAEHDFGAADQLARTRGQAVDAVLADSDNGQPTPQCGTVLRTGLDTRLVGNWHVTHPHSRRHDGSAGIGRAPRQAPRTRSCRVASRPYQISPPPPSPPPHRCLCSLV